VSSGGGGLGDGQGLDLGALGHRHRLLEPRGDIAALSSAELGMNDQRPRAASNLFSFR